MRRTDRELTRQEGLEFLKRAHWGVLSLIDGDRVMSVPISYGMDADGSLYFHGASAGRKAALMKSGVRCTFVAVASETPWLENFKHLYESVIVEGTLEELAPEAAQAALFAICGHYGNVPPQAAEYATGSISGGAVRVWRLQAAQLTAKACRRS